MKIGISLTSQADRPLYRKKVMVSISAPNTLAVCTTDHAPDYSVAIYRYPKIRDDATDAQ